MCDELFRAGIPFRQQVRLPLKYGDIEIGSGCVADLIVRGEVILELKAWNNSAFCIKLSS